MLSTMHARTARCFLLLAACCCCCWLLLLVLVLLHGLPSDHCRALQQPRHPPLLTCYRYYITTLPT